MNNTTGGVRLGDDVIGVIEEMFIRLRFVLHGKNLISVFLLGDGNRSARTAI